MSEIRKQLSQRELQTLAEVDAMVAQARNVLAEQEQKQKIALSLIFDRHDVAEGAKNLQIDPKTGELVFQLEGAQEPGSPEGDKV